MDPMERQGTGTVLPTATHADVGEKRPWSAPNFDTAEIAKVTEVTLGNIFSSGFLFS